MGMYTGISIDVFLKSHLPDNVVEALKIMTLVTEWERRPKEKLCEHPLFDCDRWQSVLSGQSAYFPECQEEQPEVNNRFSRGLGDLWRLNASASLKNYNGEIDKFLDWLAPYVDTSEYGKEVGWRRYEECRNSTFFTFTEKGVVERTEDEHEEDRY